MRLLSPFVYYIGKKHSNLSVIVPVGTLTDFASVPLIPEPKQGWVRWVQSLPLLKQSLAWYRSEFTPLGSHGKAAVLHDWLYQQGWKGYRGLADRVFLEAMSVSGVPKWKRRIMYGAVRLLGWRSYGRVGA